MRVINLLSTLFQNQIIYCCHIKIFGSVTLQSYTACSRYISFLDSKVKIKDKKHDTRIYFFTYRYLLLHAMRKFNKSLLINYEY
jgi:hypothetical protein